MECNYLMRSVLLSCVLLGLSQPLHARQRNSDQEVNTIVSARIDNPEQASGLDSAGVSEILKKPLTLNDAIWITYNLNPEMKAKLAEGQVSLATLKQRGLVESPQVGVETFVPTDPGFNTAVILTFTQNVIDLIQLPARKGAAQADYESKKWEIAQDILGIITNVKKAYYNYQAAVQLKAFWRSNLLAAQSEAALAKGQRDAGNISRLDEDQHVSLLKVVQIELKRSETRVIKARLELEKHMGIAVPDSALRVAGELPNLPTHDPALTSLKEWALANRADLISQKYQIESRKKSVQLAKAAWVPNLNLGVGAEWDAEGAHGVGPVIQMGIPFLGHRKANVHRAKSELDQSEKTMIAMQQKTPYDVEETYQELLLARQTAQLYKTEIIPLQSRILDESNKFYNYMLLGNYQLLQNKMNQINAKREYIEAMREYWDARADLEFLVGGSFRNKMGGN